MLKRNILLITVFILFQNAYSQFPIGKNTEVAEKEIKQILKTNGYTFLNKTVSTDETVSLKFSEEFSVLFDKNHYENVSYMNISTFKKKIIDRLKTTFNFSKWIYIGELPNIANELESVYRYKGFKIRMPHSIGMYQFTVTLNEE